MTAETLQAALGSAELAAGLRFGLAALAVGLAAAFARRAGSAPATAAAGLLFAAGFALALRQTLGLPAGLGFGLLALAGAGAAGGLPLAPLLAVAGAWLVAWRSGLALDQWTRLLVAAATVLGAWLLADFDARWRRRGAGPVLLAVSVAGVYATVPDTEQALAALGVALPLALLGWPWPLASLGRAGAYAATGALLWVVAAGGSQRGSAIVGGVACLGLLAVEPMARLLDRRRQSVLDGLPSGRWGTAAAAVLHLGLVYLAARVVGLRPGTAGAATLALVGLAAAVLLALLVTAARRRAANEPSPP